MFSPVIPTYICDTLDLVWIKSSNNSMMMEIHSYPDFLQTLFKSLCDALNDHHDDAGAKKGILRYNHMTKSDRVLYFHNVLGYNSPCSTRGMRC